MSDERVAPGARLRVGAVALFAVAVCVTNANACRPPVGAVTTIQTSHGCGPDIRAEVVGQTTMAIPLLPD